MKQAVPRPLISRCRKYIISYLTERNRKNLEETGTYADIDIDSPVSSTKSESDTNSNASHHVESQRKVTHDQILDDKRKNEIEISQTSNSGDDSSMEGTSVVHTKLPPGKASILYFYNRRCATREKIRGCPRNRPFPLELRKSHWLNLPILSRSCEEERLLAVQEGLPVRSTELRFLWSVHNFLRVRLQHILSKRYNLVCHTKTATIVLRRESTVRDDALSVLKDR